MIEWTPPSAGLIYPAAPTRFVNARFGGRRGSLSGEGGARHTGGVGLEGDVIEEERTVGPCGSQLGGTEFQPGSGRQTV